MRGTNARRALACALFGGSTVPSLARAEARELYLGPTVGGGFSTGVDGGAAGSAGATAGYGLTDAFRVYCNLEYSLGASTSTPPPAALRHAATLSAGVAYTLDVASVVPWFGLGAQGAVVVARQWSGVVPAVEARVGLDWLLSRSFGLTFQAAYGLVFANRSHVGDTVTGLAGVRWSWSL
jgi:hypothetical protein